MTILRIELPATECVQLRSSQHVLHVILNRPQQRNAISLAMVSELQAVFDAIQPNDDYRIVVLRGAGGVFSAGGDVRDMAEIQGPGDLGAEDPLVAINRAFGTLLTQIEQAPQAVIAVVEGLAMGGGLGLVAASDLALAVASARFGMPEVRLGLVPAQILPFVARRVGMPQTRRLALTGGMLNAAGAQKLGLIHHVCQSPIALDTALDTFLARLGRCGPEAIAATKMILNQVDRRDLDDVLDDAARTFARTARSDEAREGIQAFLAKRYPSWAIGANNDEGNGDEP